MPGRERLGRDPDREAAALLECPVVLRPIRYPVARPGDLVTARFIGLVGHRSSGERGSGPIRPTVGLPKPRVAILHQRHPQLLEVSDDVTAEWVLDLWTLAPTPAKGRTPARDDAGPAASEAPDPPGRSRAGGWPLASARDPSG